MATPLPPEFEPILEKLETKNVMNLLCFLNEQVLREQEIYWQRFYSFATLHAGAFVLATSDSVRAKGWLAIAGLTLALIWMCVQWLSLGYADRLKEPYHKLRKSVGIKFNYEPDAPLKSDVGGRLRRMPRLSSTNLGMGVTILVAVVWLMYFIQVPWWVEPK